MKLFLLLICLKLINAKITIDIKTDESSEISINYSGVDVKVVTDDEIELFKINDRNLKEALKKRYGKKPSHVFLKRPTLWGDLYKQYNWEEVSRILAIKSARVKGITKNPVLVMSQDFENLSNNTIKVNTGISQTVENTISTSWTKNNEIQVSQELEYEVNVMLGKIAGNTGFSYTTSWGKTEERSETVTIGTTSAVETELKPSQAATAVLSATRGHVEIEIIYSAKLRGNVVVNFKKKLDGHHFWGPPIENVMKSGDLKNEILSTEVIRIGFYSDASLKVFDKVTKVPL